MDFRWRCVHLKNKVEIETGRVIPLTSYFAERHYNLRPLDLLRMWHDKLEAWILKEARIDITPEQNHQGLQAVSQ